MLKIKYLEIGSGIVNFSLIRKEDAQRLRIHSNEKVRLVNPKTLKKTVCFILILDNCQEISIKELPTGTIGLFENIYKKINLKEGDKIDFIPLPKPRSLRLVHKKFAGKSLNEKEYFRIISDIVDGLYSREQITFFVAANAVFTKNIKEIAFLTKAMYKKGEVLKFERNQLIIDKHCIGGIPGNRTTPIIVAILACLNYTVPNTFTKAITSPSGTADTLGCYLNVVKTTEEMKKVIEKTNASLVWWGGIDLVPADDIIIRAEHPINLDSKEQMVASILAKKKAAGLTHCLLDIPYGSQAKVKNKQEAEELGYIFELVAREIDLNLKIVLTKGNQPIGRGVWPLLEMIDILKVLKNEEDAPQDLVEKSIFLTGELINFVDGVKNGQRQAKKILDSGLAYQKFMEIREAQGSIELESLAQFSKKIKAKEEGIIKKINIKDIVHICNEAGTPLDIKAGVVVEKKLKEMVKKDDVLFTIYSSNEQKLKNAVLLAKGLKIFKIKK